MARLGFPLITSGILVILIALHTFTSVGSQINMPAIIHQGNKMYKYFHLSSLVVLFIYLFLFTVSCSYLTITVLNLELGAPPDLLTPAEELTRKKRHYYYDFPRYWRPRMRYRGRCGAFCCGEYCPPEF